MTAEEYQLFDELLATVNTMRKAKGLSWTELGIYSHVANPILLEEHLRNGNITPLELSRVAQVLGCHVKISLESQADTTKRG